MIFIWDLKILLCSWLNIALFKFFFTNDHIYNVVSTLSNIVQLDVENEKVASTFSNVLSSNIDVNNVVSTLIWRCLTSRGHINLSQR